MCVGGWDAIRHSLSWDCAVFPSDAGTHTLTHTQHTDRGQRDEAEGET